MLVSSAHPTTKANNKAQQAPYHIYEIQTILPHSGKYASYFVGSRIVSNPALHVTTRVDPLYFALAHLQRQRNNNNSSSQLEKWQPWDQALGDVPAPVLRALNLDPNLNIDGMDGVGQLGHLFDVSDMCGDDLILCKFSEERTLKWLVAKFERSVEGLRRRLREKKRRAVQKSHELKSMQGGAGAFSSSFAMAEEDEEPKSDASKEKEKGNDVTDDTLTKEEEQSIRVGALQLICGYIPSEWSGKLAKEAGLTEEDLTGKKKTKSSTTKKEGEDNHVSSEKKRPRSSWEGNIGQEDADALLQFTTGAGGGGSKVITPGDKKEVRNAQSVGLKRLAKVNTKGMKSLTSFFGAGKKKAKK